MTAGLSTIADLLHDHTRQIESQKAELHRRSSELNLIPIEGIRAIAVGGAILDSVNLFYTLEHWLLETGQAGLADVGEHPRIFPDDRVIAWGNAALVAERDSFRARKGNHPLEGRFTYSWHELKNRLTEKAIAILILKLNELLESPHV